MHRNAKTQNEITTRNHEKARKENDILKILGLCMCVCVHMSVSVCIYVCVCVRLYVCIYVCI